MNKGCSIQLFDQDADHPSLRCDCGADVELAQLRQELRDKREEIRDLEQDVAYYSDKANREKMIRLHDLEERITDIDINTWDLRFAADALASELEGCEQGLREAASIITEQEHSNSELRAGLKESKKQKRELVEMLKKLHDECSVLPINGKRLNMGPMMEPSEQTVFEARALLKRHGGE